MLHRAIDWPDLVGQLTGLAHIATADAEGTPAVAIVSAIVEDDHLWFQTRSGSRKARNLVANDRIAMMWQPGSEVYLWGVAEVSNDIATKQRLWSQWPYDAAGFFGEPEREDVVLVRVAPRRASMMAMGTDGPERLVWESD